MTTQSDQSDLAVLARQNMVASQVRTNKVWDMQIVNAMESIPREQFVPESHQALAYIDEDIMLPGGRIVMEPMIAARMVQALELNANDVAVEIASGLGFASAVMAKLARTVIAIESDAAMVEASQTILLENGCDNAVSLQADVVVGAGEPGSVDAIFVNGAVEREPTELFVLLSERGRLVCPLVNDRGQCQVVLFTKYGESISRRPLFDANVPVLPEFKAVKAFSF